MKFAKRVFKHMLPSDVNRQIVPSDSFVESLEFLTEEATFDVEVEYARVVHEDCKGSIG